MRLGIYTRYRRHEATYAAIRIACFAHGLGYDVSLFTEDRAKTCVHPEWDRAAVRGGPQSYESWAAKCDTICWTHVPPVSQINWANARDKSTILFALWTELSSEDRKAFRKAKIVLCPTVAAAALLAKRWRLQTCRVAMWDVGLPITTKPKPEHIPKPRVLIPSDLFAAPTPELTALIISALEFSPDVEMTLSYVPSRWKACDLCDLRGLARTGRLRLVPSTSEPDRPLLFQQHDLTLWPVPIDNFGYGALYSRTLGTPVLAFETPAAVEALDGSQSVRVAAEVVENGLGVPSIVPDYPTYLNHLLGILLDPLMLPAMLDESAEDLLHRKRQFTKVMTQVLAS